MCPQPIALELERYTPPSWCQEGAIRRQCASSTWWLWLEGACSARPFFKLVLGFKIGSFAFAPGRSSRNQALQATTGHRVLRFVRSLVFLKFVGPSRRPAAPERQAVTRLPRGALWAASGGGVLARRGGGSSAAWLRRGRFSSFCPWRAMAPSASFAVGRRVTRRCRRPKATGLCACLFRWRLVALFGLGVGFGHLNAKPLHASLVVLFGRHPAALSWLDVVAAGQRRGFGEAVFQASARGARWLHRLRSRSVVV